MVRVLMNNMESIKNPVVYRSNYVPDTGLEKFQRMIEKKYKVTFDSYKDLHKWTVENYTTFWEEIWNFSEVISSEPYKQVFVKTGPGFLDNEWFSGAKLNYAENVLRIRDDKDALICLDEFGTEEHVTFAEIFQEVKLYSAAFRKNGLEKGDRVACFMSNRKEAIFAFLAVASIGAMWGGPVPFYGPRTASDIIKMMDAKFLITVDEHQENGVNFPTIDYIPEIVNNSPTIKKVILVITKSETREKDISSIRKCVCLEDFLKDGFTSDGKVPDIIFEQLSFDHPLNINFTSGTTGLPKPTIHSAGALICLLRDYKISYDLKKGDVVCLNYPMGWSMWEYMVPCLALGVKIFLNCSSPYYQINGKNFWEILAKYNVSLVLLITSMADQMEKMEIKPSCDTNLDCLKIIAIGGSPVKKENFEYLKNKVKKDVYVAAMYGATELCGFFSGFNMNMPVYSGEIQIPSLGMDIQCLVSDGKSVVGQKGELAVCTPAPNFPVGLWKDENNKILTSLYLERYPGVWSQNDQCWINPKTSGFIVTGRSDNTLKQRGERFGSGDIYFAIHSLDELEDYICVGQTKENGDNRAILFVKMKGGYKMTEEIKNKIERAVYADLWEDCVPELILEIPEIPYNLNNKRMEGLVTRIVETNNIPEIINVKNPDSLKHYLNIPEIVNYNS